MTRKKKTEPELTPEPAKEADRHKKPRIGVNIPKNWHEIARKLAIKSRQPVVWYLISIIAEQASKEGIDMPLFPWEEE